MSEQETLDREGYLRQRLGKAWDTLAPHADTIVSQPGLTIRPPETGTAPRSLDTLRSLSTPRAEHLRFREALGEGGSGVVHLATQVSLGRHVAVKTLRPDRLSPGTLRGLVQEAWLTGWLEHPNVVPVHDMGLDADGRPLIVMKRIEGVAWTDLIADPQRVRDGFGVDEVFDWHLGVLMQVCSAMRYAHSRGIIHRDLKPANVMVGDYGEVYVVDWGIAVSLRGDGDGRLPLAAHADELAGTPAYMAPEMVGGRADDLSERTDVYLLGAILYELVEGQPPHRGPGIVELLDSVVGEPPGLSDDAPEELVEICRRAMARDPADRYPDVESFRLALQGFLDHRESNRLAAQAERRLAELVAAIDDAEVHRDVCYKLFGECRFGFRQALASWPENQRARDGLQWATTAMIERELAGENPSAAAGLLAELEDPAPALAARVEQARAAEREERARMERLRRDYDLRTGSRARAMFALIFGALWTLQPLLREWGALGADSYLGSALGPALFAVVGAGLVFRWRDALLRSAINRSVVGAMFLAMLGWVLLDVANWLMGVPYRMGMVHHEVLGLLVLGMLSVSADRRLAPAAVAYGVGLVACAAWPAAVHYLMAAVNAILATNLAVIWWVPSGGGDRDHH